jgi:site-specific DNA-methyltransferase (adenine-specific)
MTREIVGTKKQDWATPRSFFEAIHAEYSFTVDVCAASYNKLLPVYFGEGGVEPDGLKASWVAHGGRAFCNPPYEDIEAWMQKAIEEAAQGCLSVFLVPANTDTKWFHTYAKLGLIDFIKGRLSFEDLTPPEVEIARLVAAYEKSPAKGLLKSMGLCFNELFGFVADSHGDRLRALPPRDAENEHLFKASEFLDTFDMPEDERKPGPGFPSMLVTFDPASAASPGMYRTRSRTGELL